MLYIIHYIIYKYLSDITYLKYSGVLPQIVLHAVVSL